jgi:hypothetical protein
MKTCSECQELAKRVKLVMPGDRRLPASTDERFKDI